MESISRRKFVSLTAAGVATMPLALRASAAKPITAQDVIDRIKQSVGGDWNADTLDTFKAGDPSTHVSGIATASLASLGTLQKAIKLGANLIITSEPTFFSKADTPTPPVRRLPGAPNIPQPSPAEQPAPDRVFSAKAEFIKQHNLIVWRFADHWRTRTPDPFAHGLSNTFGWPKFSNNTDPKHLIIQETSLEALASNLKNSLKSRGGIRVIGDPRLRIQKVALLPGNTPLQASLQTLPNVDAIIAGEVREWETVEYVRDAVDLGGKKALILIGRIVSENPGMQICAQWLKMLVPEVNSTWISVDDPYWRPA